MLSAGTQRKLIYLIMIIAVSWPLIMGSAVQPARMKAAEKVYQQVEELARQPQPFAMVSLDFGPNTKAENASQAEVIIEHLLRKRIPFALFTLYYEGVGFLETIPEKAIQRLQKEDPTFVAKYGINWINLGYKPGYSLFLQGFAKSDNLAKYLGKDSKGQQLQELQAFSGITTLKDVDMLFEFSGLTGMLEMYVQFFQKDGYVPAFAHGCTSISIPQSFIYLDSGQLKGLFEGIAGAAWYSDLLSQEYTGRVRDVSKQINTALNVAHLTIIAFIILGNLSVLYHKIRGARQ